MNNQELKVIAALGALQAHLSKPVPDNITDLGTHIQQQRALMSDVFEAGNPLREEAMAKDDGKVLSEEACNVIWNNLSALDHNLLVACLVRELNDFVRGNEQKYAFLSLLESPSA